MNRVKLVRHNGNDDYSYHFIRGMNTQLISENEKLKKEVNELRAYSDHLGSMLMSLKYQLKKMKEEA